MASARDFAQLEQLDGISRVLLVQGDGQLINKTTGDGEIYGPLIAASGTQCDTLSADMSGSRYLYLCLERKSGQDILVFPLGRYYLGIIKHAESERQEIIDNVIYFLKNLS
jgi:hypothetical protein